jgi:hypothetical protein
MPRFRVVDPRGLVVATCEFDSAKAAYPWFIDSIAGNSELGWRMEVEDEGQWAFFDDTASFTAPSSRRPPPNGLTIADR